MTVLSVLPIDKEITTAGQIICQVTAGSVNIKLHKKKNDGWKEISKGKYGVTQGFSSTLITEVDTKKWRITVKGDALSAVNLTIP